MTKSAMWVVLAVLGGACSVYEGPSGTPQGGAGGAGGASGSGPSTGGGDAGQGGSAGSMAGSLGGDAAGAGGTSEPDGGGGAGGEGPVDSGPTSTEDAPEGRDAPDTSISDAIDAPVDTGAVSDGSTCALFALQFSGFQGYVRVNRPVQDDFTLEAWIKAPTPGIMTGTNFWEGSGLLYADTAGDADDFGAVLLGSKFAFGVGNPNTTIASTSNVATGSWVHVAATRRKSTGEIQLFVNGTMEASMVVAAQVRSLGAQPNMTIGGNAVDNRYFTGILDEVRAWNVVRSAPEIASTMRKRLTGAEPGLVGYWRFDEGTGLTAADASLAAPDASRPKNNGDLFGPINWIGSDAPVCP